MIRRPPRTTRTATRFPYPPLFRSGRSPSESLPAPPLSPRCRCGPGLSVDNDRHRAAVLRPGFLVRSDRRRAFLAIADDVNPRRIDAQRGEIRSEEHTSELQSLMRISYAVFCLKKKNIKHYET